MEASNYEKLATAITPVKILAQRIDLDTLQQAVKDFQDQCSRSEATLILVPGATPRHIDRMRANTKALNHLAGFIKELKTIEEIERDLPPGTEVMQQLFQL